MDVADNETERVGEQHRVGNLIAEAVDDIRGPAFAALLLFVAKRVEDLLKLDVGAIRSLSRIVEYHSLNLDIHVGGAGIEQEGLKGLGLGHARQRCGLQIVREEVKGVGEVPLQRGMVAPVVELRPARQIVFADALDGDMREVAENTGNSPISSSQQCARRIE